MDLTSKRLRVPDSHLAVYEESLRLGWGDGLPVIPPTEELVAAMLEAASRPPQDVVAWVPPSYSAATVEKVAVNAVLAGCAPVHLPAVIAAVEAVNDRRFNLVHMGTSPGTPLIVVNGPARIAMGMGTSYNTLGSGHRANLAIGRAVRLVLQNVGLGGAHGIQDQTTIGHPGRISMCMAENEESSPWEPLHVERGFERDASTVTVFNATGLLNIWDEEAKKADSLINTIGRSMITAGMNNVLMPTAPLLILGTEHARFLASGGYSKEQVRQKVWELARLPLAALSPEQRDFLRTRSLRKKAVVNDEVHITDEAATISIVVAGGLGPHSMFAPTVGSHPSDAITKQFALPKQ